MTKRRGIFISLEGAEGSGKSTQARLLQAAIQKRWGKCILTREPGGTLYAEAIRALALYSEEGAKAGAHTIFELMWAARVDHVGKLILPTLLKGTHVVTDRFDAATFGYQIHGQGAHDLTELFFLKRRTYLESQGASPSLYVFLDVDPKEGLKRIAERTTDRVSHFDRRKVDFHRKVREGHRAFVRKFRSVTIDANQAPEKVHQDIMKSLEAQKLFAHF